MPGYLCYEAIQINLNRTYHRSVPVCKSLWSCLEAQWLVWSSNLLYVNLSIGNLSYYWCFRSYNCDLFEDAGLRNLYIEAEIVAIGSITWVLSGKMYNVVTSAHKLMHEALVLLKLWWDSFIPWFDDNYQPETRMYELCSR